MDNLQDYLQTIRREDEERHTQAIAQQFNLPYISLIGYPILPDVLSIIPQEIAETYGVVSFMRAGTKVRIAIANPADPKVTEILQKISQETGYEFNVSVCSPTSINYAFSIYKKLASTRESSETVTVTKETEEKAFATIKNLSDVRNRLQTVTTTSLIDLIFAGAVKTDASDIHLEPAEDGVRVRYRIDGVLQEVSVLNLSMYKQLNSRIKFLAGLKLDVKSTPQDGRFTIKSLDEEIDIRVSTMPATYGEIIDMRLLNSKKQMVDLSSLGFRPDALKLIEEAIVQPNGLILNTGPTGSGKTTTLYSILMRLNKPGVKVITLEDPVEYRIAGIDQVQIDPEHNYTFASALRASLRQDPNIVMVGEIRDKETAEIAFQASMTGHLVLSTLHTNNAPAAIPRLIDMGVEPYLLAGSINLIIAQRLVRKICVKCQGKGCEICNETGYKGRVAIIECLKPTVPIEKLIMAKAPLSKFLETAKSEGMVTMEDDGMQKVAAGITTQEEIWRVTKE